MIHEGARSVYLKAPGKREFFLIHGYTGSVTDFNELAEILNKKFNATVRIIRLEGHGTTVRDLDNLDYKDFYRQVENELKKDLAEGKEIVLGGVSFGSFLAMSFAAKYPIRGVFTISLPYELHPMLNMGTAKIIRFLGKYWKKKMSCEEKKLREKAYYYEDSHINCISILKKSKDMLQNDLENITCPLLTILSKKDTVMRRGSVLIPHEKAGSKIKDRLILDTKWHNPLYSEKNEETCKAIVDFFEKHKIFDR